MSAEVVLRDVRNRRATPTLRCSAVLRRTARIGWRSIAPQRVKSGSGSAATAAPDRARASASGNQALRVRLHIVDRNAAVGTAAGDLIDVHAELARHAADRRRRRRRRQFRCGRFGGGARAAIDVHDLAARGPGGSGRPFRGLARRRRTRRFRGFVVFERCRGGRWTAAAGAAAAGAAALGSGAFGSAALAAGALPPAPSSTLRIAWPTFTLSPTLTLMSLTWPATDEGTSMVALSVSSSRTG